MSKSMRLRDTVRTYLGLAPPGSQDYCLAYQAPPVESAPDRLQQLYAPPPPFSTAQQPTTIAAVSPQQPQPQQFSLPPAYAASSSAAAYPPPPEIMPLPRRGSSATPQPLPAMQGVAPAGVPSVMCAAPSPVMTPGSRRSSYAPAAARRVPHGRGRGKGRYNRSDTLGDAQAIGETWGRGLALMESDRSRSGSVAPMATPSPVQTPPGSVAPISPAAVGAIAIARPTSGSFDIGQQPSPLGEGGMQHHHHHRHYHREFQQQQEVTPAKQAPVVVRPTLGAKELKERRDAAVQPVRHRPLFIIAVTVVEIALYIYELIATSKVSKITFGSNPWQWGGVDVNTLINIGGKYAPYIVHRHEWWRFITPIFLHVSLPHIIMNLLMQVKVGITLERSYGAVRVFLLYLMCGVAGNLLSCIFLYTQIQAGASGALFGFMGLLIVDLVQNWKIVMNPMRNLVVLIISVIISLAFGMMPGVDNFAHIGGCLMGIAGGFLILPSLAPKKKGGCPCKAGRTVAVLISLPIVILAFAGLFVLFYRLVATGHDSTQWCKWCSQINCASAILGTKWCKSA